MQIVMLATDIQFEEWNFPAGTHNVKRVNELEEFREMHADVYIDMEFEYKQDRIQFLKTLPATVLVNSVSFTLNEIGAAFIRFNGWSTFISRGVIEATCDEKWRETAADIFNALHKKMEWVADSPGFITPRIVSMIINEGFYALQDGVSSKMEIDTAMKLGTSYPFGPFEWNELIGPKNVYTLLQQLQILDKKYAPAPGFAKEINT